MEPFDIEAAARGEKVVTRDGLNVRVLCVDRPGKNCVVVMLPDGDVVMADKAGHVGVYPYELFMAPKKVTLWRRLVRWSNGCPYGYQVVTDREFAAGKIPPLGLLDRDITDWEQFEVEE